MGMHTILEAVVRLLVVCSITYSRRVSALTSAIGAHIVPLARPMGFSSRVWCDIVVETSARRGNIQHGCSLSDLQQYPSDTYMTIPTTPRTGIHHQCLHPHEEASTFNHASLAVLWSPNRLIRLSMLAWGIAAILGRLGFFDDPSRSLNESMDIAKWRIQQVYRRARAYGGILNESTWQDPQTYMTRTLYSLQPQGQFAVGTGVGMIFTRFLLGLIPTTLKTVTAFYLLSEVSHFYLGRVLKSQNVGKNANSTMVELAVLAETRLALLRISVRRVVRNPKSILASLKRWCVGTNNGGEQVIPMETMRGLGLGAVVGLFV